MKKNSGSSEDRTGFFETEPVLIVKTLLVGMIGGAVFTMLNFPMSWFLGSILFSSTLSVLGVRLYYSKNLQIVAISGIGIVLGNYVHPGLFSDLDQYLFSILVLILQNVLAVIIITTYLNRVFKLDLITSFFSAIPGGLSTMIALGDEAGGDAMVITIFQSLRLLTLLLFLTAFMAFTGISRMEKSGSVHEEFEWLQLIVFPAIIFISVFLYVKTGNLSISLIFCMLASGTFYYSGFLQMHPPQWFEQPLLVMLGANFGGRYSRFRFRQIIGTAFKAFSSAAILFLLTVLGMLLFSGLFSLDPMTLFFILFPGAFEMVTLISIEYNVDPLIVGFHHLLRMFLIILLVPWVSKFLILWKAKKKKA